MKTDSEKSKVEKILREHEGMLTLPVPMYSATKFKGKKLYEYARQGKKELVIEKQMFFYNLKIKKIQKDEITVSLSCHKGGYIRSWVHHIGKVLGCGACLYELRRTISKPYSIDRSISLVQLESYFKDFNETNAAQIDLSLAHSLLKDSFIHFKQCLSDYKSCKLTSFEERVFSHGKICVQLFGKFKEDQMKVNQEQKPLNIRLISLEDERFVGLVELRPFEKPKILNVF